MTNIDLIFQEFNAVIEENENMAGITRASNLQEEAIKNLNALQNSLKTYKAKAIGELEENSANAILSMECAALSLSCTIRMWLLLKQEKPDEAWNELIKAQHHAIGAIRAHPILSHLETFSDYLQKIETLVFPPQVFMSTGLIVKIEHCSICNMEYEECDHIAGKAYMGEFCTIVVQDSNLKEVSIVNDPADKRCRITHFDSGKGRRNRMTWAIEESDT